MKFLQGMASVIVNVCPMIFNLMQFVREDWSATLCGKCKEDLPDNVPKPRGIGLKM